MSQESEEPLFDDIEGTDTDPMTHAESKFEYYNRTARDDIGQIRGDSEGWFRRHPDRGKRDLRARFRSKDDREHEGAFFELFLHEFLNSFEDTSVTPDPELESGETPDFLVEFAGHPAILMEATVAHERSKDRDARERRIGAVYDAVDRIRIPDRAFGLRIVKETSRSPSLKRLRRSVEEAVAAVGPMNPGDNETRKLDVDGWEIELNVICTDSDPAGGSLLYRGPDMSWGTAKNPFVAALEKKAAKYRSEEVPLVIAVNTIGVFNDEMDIVQAIYGTEVIRNGSPSRLRDGLWSKPGRRSGVSAILWFNNLHPHNYPEAEVRIFHHPEAEQTLTGPLCRLPQAFESNGKLERIDGESIANIIGYSYSWLSVKERD